MGVLLGIMAMVVMFFVFYLIGLVAEPLLALLSERTTDVLLAIGFIAFTIYTNIREYRAAYVKGNGKPWHFWLFFITTIAFALLMIALAIHDITS